MPQPISRPALIAAILVCATLACPALARPDATPRPVASRGALTPDEQTHTADNKGAPPSDANITPHGYDRD